MQALVCFPAFVMEIEKKVAYIPPSLRKTTTNGDEPQVRKSLDPPLSLPSPKAAKLSPHEKLIKNITQKLKQINLLKAKQVSGESLELNQVLHIIIIISLTKSTRRSNC